MGSSMVPRKYGRCLDLSWQILEAGCIPGKGLGERIWEIWIPAAPAQGIEEPTGSLSSTYKHPWAGCSGGPCCSPYLLEHHKLVLGSCASVNLHLEPAQGKRKGEHGHGDRSVPQMLTKQLVITSVLRAARQRLQSELHAPLHSLPQGGGTRTTLKGSISSSSVQKQSGNAPVRKAARGFHCPTSLSQLPAPRDGIKTHPSTTGHLSAVH